MIQLMEKAASDDTRVLNLICDSTGDLSNLPTQEDDKSLGYGKAAMGSTCICIGAGALYMLNSSGSWVKYGA